MPCVAWHAGGPTRLLPARPPALHHPPPQPNPAPRLQVVPKPDRRREVVLVDRRHDQHLAAMHEEAAAAVARCGPGDSLARFQALAHVVAGHMGGALVGAAQTAPALEERPAVAARAPPGASAALSALLARRPARPPAAQDSRPAAAEQWCGMINRLKVQGASVVVLIGLLHMGADRHRALLYKALADGLGLPCRIVKGRRLEGEAAPPARPPACPCPCPCRCMAALRCKCHAAAPAGWLLPVPG